MDFDQAVPIACPGGCKRDLVQEDVKVIVDDATWNRYCVVMLGIVLVCWDGLGFKTKNSCCLE